MAGFLEGKQQISPWWYTTLSTYESFQVQQDHNIFSFMFFSQLSFHSWSIISYCLPELQLYPSINSSIYSLLLAYDTSNCFHHLAFLCTLSLQFKQCLEYFGKKRPFERMNDKNEVKWLSIQSQVSAALWLILYPTALTLWRMCRTCSVGKKSPHSPKNWNPEIVSCSNKWWPDIIVHQNKGNEDVVEVAAVHWQENEGQPRVTCLLQHL